MNLSPRIKLLFSLLLILFVSIPITLSLMQTRQDQRSGAAAGTTLALIPQPGPSDSIQKSIGDDVPIDVMIDPVSNSVTILRLQVKYDPTKLQADTETPFTPTQKFTATLSPVISNGTVSVIITTGSDPNLAIRTLTKAGSFNFKAIGDTGEIPTQVTFTAQTEVYSAGANDTARENILSSSKPAKITIGGGNPTANGTKLSFTVLLHGVGVSGDTPNPTTHSLSNKNPQHPERELQAFVYDANEQQVTSGTGTIVYQTNNENDNLNGKFIGSVILGKILSNGKYTIKVKTDRYLRKAFQGTITITGNIDNKLPQIELVAGDTNSDNVLNIIDYNALLDCGYGALNPLPISNSSAQYNSLICKTHEPRINIDIEDNGFVNAFDYNLFIRELSVQTGD
jgi:hypothetical protein